MDIYTEVGLNTPHLRTAVYEGHKGCCFYTGGFVSTTEARVDHLYPKAKGGKDCIANYVLTSHRINISKLDGLDETLIERMQYINIVAFAPKVLARYIELWESDRLRAPLSDVPEGEITLKDYAKLRGVTVSDTYKLQKTVPHRSRPKPGQRRLHRHYSLEGLDEYTKALGLL